MHVKTTPSDLYILEFQSKSMGYALSRYKMRTVHNGINLTLQNTGTVVSGLEFILYTLQSGAY